MGRVKSFVSGKGGARKADKDLLRGGSKKTTAKKTAKKRTTKKKTTRRKRVKTMGMGS
jgi:topoisomerase IA-like protein